MISRRKFIQNTGAGLFLTAIPNNTNAVNSIKKFELTAKKSKYSFEKNQNKTDLWLFNNNCPGPLITANKNDVIEIIFNINNSEPISLIEDKNKSVSLSSIITLSDLHFPSLYNE